MRLPVVSIRVLSAALLTALPAHAGAPPFTEPGVLADAQGALRIDDRPAREMARPDARAAPLAGTRWRLVEFQSMDDRQGTTRPHDPSRYTMQLGADGRVQMQLNCNRAQGDWSAEPAAERISGRFTFGPLAATRALCPPPSMDQTIVAQAPYVRGYLLRDGRLYLSLMADGGIFAWEPDPAAAPPAANVPGAAVPAVPRRQ